MNNLPNRTFLKIRANTWVRPNADVSYLNPRYALTLALVLMTAGCEGQYRGDGNLEIRGNWPFRRYSLTLPTIPIAPGEYEFTVSGLPDVGAGPRLSLLIIGTEPLVCTRLALRLSVTVESRSGELLLDKNGAVNGFVQRIFADDTVNSPNESEWVPVGLRYRQPEIESRAIPVASGVDSLPQGSCEFFAFDALPVGETVFVKVVVLSGQPDGTITISLSDGWK